MRILHLATSPGGGAGIAATRLVDAQCQFGIKSFLLTRDNQRESTETQLKRTVGKFVTKVSQGLVSKKYGVISPISISTINMSEIESYKPDILHIHNWYNFLSYRDIKKLSKYFPITFTLHDSRLATGGCHVTLGCRNFEQGCRKCPASKSSMIIELSKQSLDQCISKMGKYAVISPSKWMLKELSETELIKRADVVEVIGNCVPNNNQLSEKEVLGNPIQMCFVSASLESQFKGLDMLKESLRLLSNKNPQLRAVVKLIGNTRVNHDLIFGGIEIKTIGSVDSSGIKSILESSDLLLIPSQSDNYPSVVTEAQSAGAVIVATNVGGIPEMIVDGVDGFLSENNPEDFALNITRAINHSEFSKIRKSANVSAHKRTQSSDIASSHLTVYQKLLEK
jgi:glycosyltransferase involved in cell wall biosynthesis